MIRRNTLLFLFAATAGFIGSSVEHHLTRSKAIEIRTRGLVIINDAGEEIGRLGRDNSGGVSLSLGRGKSPSVVLEVGPDGSPTLRMAGGERNLVRLRVDQRSGATMEFHDGLRQKNVVVGSIPGDMVPSQGDTWGVTAAAEGLAATLVVKGNGRTGSANLYLRNGAHAEILQPKQQ
jgi:hypothetical protein